MTDPFLPIIKQLARKGDYILDFGSGAKERYKVWHRAGYHSCSYDPNNSRAMFTNIAEAKLYAQWHVIICSQVLEHVHDVPLVMREIHSLLVPGGYAVIRCPHTWGPRGSHFQHWLKHWVGLQPHDATVWRRASYYKQEAEKVFRLVIDMRKQRHPWVWPISHVDLLCKK